MSTIYGASSRIGTSKRPLSVWHISRSPSEGFEALQVVSSKPIGGLNVEDFPCVHVGFGGVAGAEGDTQYQYRLVGWRQTAGSGPVWVPQVLARGVVQLGSDAYGSLLGGGDGVWARSITNRVFSGAQVLPPYVTLDLRNCELLTVDIVQAQDETAVKADVFAQMGELVSQASVPAERAVWEWHGVLDGENNTATIEVDCEVELLQLRLNTDVAGGADDSIEVVLTEPHGAFEDDEYSVTITSESLSGLNDLVVSYGDTWVLLPGSVLNIALTIGEGSSLATAYVTILARPRQ